MATLERDNDLIFWVKLCMCQEPSNDSKDVRVKQRFSDYRRPLNFGLRGGGFAPRQRRLKALSGENKICF